MAFTLRVRFMGLCMFLPNPAAGFLHVLLPRTRDPANGGGGGGGHHHHHHPTGPAAGPCEVDDTFEVGRHRMMLYFHPAYAADGAGIDPAEPRPPRAVDLSAAPRALVLPTPAGAGGTVPGALPEGVLNLHELFGERTRRELYDDPLAAPHPDLAGRVSLGAGRFGARKPGAWWRIAAPGGTLDEVELSPVVEYVVPDLPGDTLRWQVAPDGGDVPELRQRNGEVELYVYHGPPDEELRAVPLDLTATDPKVEAGCAWHFAAFYSLLGPRPWRRPVPRLARHPDGTPAAGAGPDVAQAISLYTCMTGGGFPP